jgi:hypothetical protein
VVVASIHGRVGVLELWPGWPTGGSGGQYPPGGVGGQYPLASEAAQLWETLSMTSRVLGPYENHVT